MNKQYNQFTSYHSGEVDASMTGSLLDQNLLQIDHQYKFCIKENHDNWLEAYFSWKLDMNDQLDPANVHKQADNL